MSKYYIYQDTKSCIGCFSCESHCKTKNSLPIGPRLTQIISVGPRLVNNLPRMAYVFMPCFHCQDPWCVAACPWGTPQWNAETGKAVKCDFCMDRVDQGLDPACVAKCVTKCLHFGEPSAKSDTTRKRHARLVADFD